MQLSTRPAKTLNTAQGLTADTLHRIDKQLAAARGKLADIKERMNELAEAGMYPAVPSESWEEKSNTDNLYLYMRFPKNYNGSGHMGPGGRRRLYIGRDREKVYTARMKAARRKRWEQLKQKRDHLQRWINDRQTTLRRLKRVIDDWPGADVDLDETIKPLKDPQRRPDAPF